MIPLKNLKLWLWGACLLFLTLPVQAALIGLTAGAEPDVTGQVDMSYSSGTLTIDGTSDPNSIFFYIDNANGHPDPGSGFFADYDLSVNFDGSGNFTGGSLSIEVTGIGIAGVAVVGDFLVTANLVDFGFAGTDSAGVMDMIFSVTGGVWDTLGYNSVGVILPTITISSGAPAGSWDESLFAGANWSAGSESDTFIPVPAAIWLFASGIIALVGVSRSHQKT